MKGIGLLEIRCIILIVWVAFPLNAVFVCWITWSSFIPIFWANQVAKSGGSRIGWSQQLVHLLILWWGLGWSREMHLTLTYLHCLAFLPVLHSTNFRWLRGPSIGTVANSPLYLKDVHENGFPLCSRLCWYAVFQLLVELEWILVFHHDGKAQQWMINCYFHLFMALVGVTMQRLDDFPLFERAKGWEWVFQWVYAM